ncbi:MAG: serine/threonine protein kinase [Phycisphaerales bacterium]|nr:MAG: serine/threonine protein kinase [Phycisphaerales bacterium]
MTPERYRRAKQLFTEAAKRPEQERLAYVQQVVGDDREMLDFLANLLTADAAPHAFVDSDLEGGGPRVLAAGIAGDTQHDRSDTSNMPERIGRYTISHTLGEGGMGIVYLAEQSEPVRRQVAVKVIRLGMGTRQVIARFESERQALAMMNHPGIATVLDAGTVEDGRPFFVMEYVPGIRITDYCDQYSLTIRQRLELLIDVCAAIHHAHQHGIIHRDIKPSNILVTEDNGTALPKVIDFGVAKATKQRITERTLFTEQGQLIGTPSYMSPEQAAGTGSGVDIRTDVYSLGALLYELLTGMPPFDPEKLRHAPFDRVCQTIREDDPAKPSTRLGEVDTASDRWSHDLSQTTVQVIARQRGTDSLSLRKQVRGDLDWITMKAMEKDPSRRYESVASLSADIKRNLDHEPVTASPPSTGYRLKKFVRRNRAFVTGGVAVAVAIMGGLIGTTWGMLEAARQRDQAIAMSQESKAVSEMLQEMLASSRPEVSLGREVTVREILDEAARKIDTGMLKEQPRVRATINATIGRAYDALDLFDQALPHLRSALQTNRRLFGEQHPSVAEVMNDIGTLLRGTGDFEEAEKLIVGALEMRRRLFGEQHEDVAESLHSYAYLLSATGDYLKAEAVVSEALEMRRRLLGDQHPLVVSSMGKLAENRYVLGNYDEAEGLYRKVLILVQSIHDENHPQVAETMNSLAQVLRAKGNYDEAEDLSLQALEKRRKVFGELHSTVGISYHNLGALLKEKGDYEGAEQAYRRALNIYTQVLGENHTYVATTLNGLARLVYSKGDKDEAEAMVRRALGIYREVVGDEHMHVAVTMNNLALLLTEKGDLTGAESMYRQVLNIYKKTLGEQHSHVATALWNISSTQLERGDTEAAIASRREALAVRRTALGNEHRDALSDLTGLGRLLLKVKRPDEAEPLLRECLSTRMRILAPDDGKLAQTRSLLAQCLTDQQKYEEAETLLLANFSQLEANPQADAPRKRQIAESLAQLYEAWGKPGKAAQYRLLIPAGLEEAIDKPGTVGDDSRAGEAED